MEITESMKRKTLEHKYKVIHYSFVEGRKVDVTTKDGKTSRVVASVLLSHVILADGRRVELAEIETALYHAWGE